MKMKEHTILKDFPEMSERIHATKKNNSHFAGLSDKYDDLEHKIHLMESGTQSFTDEELDALKKRRLRLKDELFSLLHSAA